MKVKPIIRGLTTYIPGISHFSKIKGRTNEARYCYSIWLRHLVMAYNNGLSTEPKVIAELGPGSSIGAGLAALISGAEKYYAFDVAEFASTQRNLKVFDELVTLFSRREEIPSEAEFPLAKPYLTSYEFPNHILTDERLSSGLDNTRLNHIKNSITDMDTADSMIRYKAPWFESDIVEKESVDMIYSQAVLEHIDDLRGSYEVLFTWLKPNGFMSHQIDFKCHGMADEWNGHWTYSDFIWKLMRGRRRYLLNREPVSTHINLMKETGFSIVYEKDIKSPSKLAAKDLAPRFRNIPEDDLTTSDAFIQAKK